MVLDFTSPDANVKCQTSSLLNFSAARTSAGSDWVTPRPESLPVRSASRQTRQKGKTIGDSEFHPPRLSYECIKPLCNSCVMYSKGNDFTSRWNYAEYDFDLNGLHCKAFSFSGDLTQREGSEPRFNTLVHAGSFVDRSRDSCDFSRDAFSLPCSAHENNRVSLPSCSWHSVHVRVLNCLQVSLIGLFSHTMNTGYSQRRLFVDKCDGKSCLWSDILLQGWWCWSFQAVLSERIR